MQNKDKKNHDWSVLVPKINELRKTMDIETACEQAGVGPSCYYRALKRMGMNTKGETSKGAKTANPKKQPSRSNLPAIRSLRGKIEDGNERLNSRRHRIEENNDTTGGGVGDDDGAIPVIMTRLTPKQLAAFMRG